MFGEDLVSRQLNCTRTVMSDNIQEEGLEPLKPESMPDAERQTKDVIETNSQQETNGPDETANPAPETPKSEIEIMEVHHHPHVDSHLHGKKHFKEYFLEFIMMFLAVSLGFLSENLRENMVNHEKEKHYIESIIADLKTDTANITLSVHMQNLLLKKMDEVLKIPIEKLDDLSMQDALYQN